MGRKLGKLRLELYEIFKYQPEPSSRQIYQLTKSKKCSERWVWQVLHDFREDQKKDAEIVSRIDKMSGYFIELYYQLTTNYVMASPPTLTWEKRNDEIYQIVQDLMVEFNRDERGRKVKES